MVDTAGKIAVLKQYFGYDSFRPGQEPIIDALAAGGDVLGVMPTGAGKSLCYQVPALLLPGLALVVSPLISLMKDQVNALTQAGVPAAFINSSLTPAQHRAALQEARAGRYKILYVAPERLDSEGFLEFAAEAPISLVAVDEAHCVSQWGQDFRPSYLRIAAFISSLRGRPPVGAFTATATAEVRRDIVALLELREPLELATGFDRPNLFFEVRKPRDKLLALLDFLGENEDKSGIVYCSTRKNVEEVCTALCQRGIPATRYHAGLRDAERRENQEDFLYDRCRVMAATNAFGMGIDKSNVSFVVHYNMPKDLESYYQEAGRAGRDGTPAKCVLFYSGQDVVTNQYLMEHGRDNDELSPEARALVLQRERQRLREMTFYCHTQDCLRAYILRYFGEEAESYCGNCGSCCQNFEEADVSVEAQKILSCVKRMGERFGAKLVADTLRGGKGERVQRLGFDRLSTYGIMADVSEQRIRDIINYLVLEGCLTLTEGEYPVLRLGPRAWEVLRGERALQMKLVKEEKRQQQKKARAPRERGGATAAGGELEHPRLFARLRVLRSELANAQGVPAYVVFTDASLRDMCQKLPGSREALLEVSGVGRAKLERYGDLFLKEIAAYLAQGE